MQKRFWLLFCTLILVLSSVLAGCSNNKASSREKTLIYGRGADSKLLDPIQVTDGESLHVTEQIFDTLVRYEPTSTKVEPSLAESWTTSPDGLEWTFKLRKGVKFKRP